MQISETQYRATYNNTAVFTTDTDDTAWYMEYTSSTASRSKQYQGKGDTYTTQVIGDITVYAETRSNATPNKVSIVRDYGNDVYRIQQISYVSNSFELPDAPAISGYTFEGYFIGENSVSSSIDISDDVVVTAKYEAKTSGEYSVIVKSTNGDTLYAKEADDYNTKVTVSDDNAYAWVEKTGSTYRPYYIGSELTFYVTESTDIKAVTQAEFEAYNFTLPCINVRRSAIRTEQTEKGTKGYFNGQIVNDPSGETTILEYGYLVAIKNNSLPKENELVLENAGTHDDYRIIRAKSTKPVGANQFVVSVNKLSDTVIYRGYITYQTGSQNGVIKTVYTDCFTK